MFPHRIRPLVVLTLALNVAGALFAAAQEEPRKGEDRSGDSLPENAVARFGNTRLRHAGMVYSVAFSADAKTLASASGDGTVRLWETSTGKEKQTFTFPNEQLTSVVFFKDGKTLAAASGNGSIRILEIDTGKVRHSLTGHGPGQMKLVLNAEKQRLYSASWADGTLREWDVENGKEVRTLASNRGTGSSTLALSADGKTLAAASAPITGEIRLYDTQTGKELRQLPWGKGGIATLAFAGDGKSLVIGGQNNTLALYDAENGKEIQPFRSNNFFGMVNGVAFSPSGKVLATANNGPNLLLWGVASGKELRRLDCSTGGTSQIAYSPDGKMVAAACNDSRVRLWDVESGKELHNEGGFNGQVQTIRFLADGKTVVASDTARGLRSWDVATHKELARLPGMPTATLAGWGVAADGKSIVYAGFDRSLHFWDPIAGKELRKLENLSQFISQCGISADGKTLAVSENGRAIHVHNVETGKEIKTFTSAPNENLGYLMVLSPDGRRLACGGYGTMHVWDVASGADLWKVDPNSNLPMQGYVFSPDGKTFAVSQGLQIRVLEVASRQERLHMEHPQDTPKNGVRAAMPFSVVVHSPDGAVLAAAGQAGDVALFDVATGKEIGKLTGHRGSVTALTFSSDGRLLASGGLDTTVVVWDVANIISKNRPAVAAPTAAELASLWQDLAGDPVKAHRAIWMMTADPARAVAILKGRLEPGAPTDAKRIAKLVADLDSDDFDTREKASEALANLPEADEAMKKALEGKPSLELRRRIEAILDGRKPSNVNVQQVREARAVEALELVGSAEARQVLEKVAKGPAEALLTRDAKEALERMSRKGNK